MHVDVRMYVDTNSKTDFVSAKRTKSTNYFRPAASKISIRRGKPAMATQQAI